MYTLIVRGARRTVLAVHHCDSFEDVQEMLAVYYALGYESGALTVEKRDEEQAA